MPWGSAYARQPQQGGGRRGGGYGGAFVAPPAATKATDKPGSHHGGLLATLKHVLEQTPKDLGEAALHAPSGVAKLTVDTVKTINETAPWQDRATRARGGILGGPLGEDVKAIAENTVDTLKHPLRHPGDTLLTVLPAAEGVARGTEAGRLARAGAPAKDVVRAATGRGKPAPRVLKVGGMEVRGHYSRSAASRLVQEAVDKTLQKGSERSVRVENLLHRRASRFEMRNQRVADAQARIPGTIVDEAGKHLAPEELRALRLVAEETPVERRIGAMEMRKARAKGAELGRHQERIDLTRKAADFLTQDASGRPLFKPEAAKLQTVYDALKNAVGDREQILKRLNLMDEEALQAAKTKTGRVAAGEPVHEGELPLDYSPPTITDAPSAALQRRLTTLDGEYQKLLEQAMEGRPGDYKGVTAIQNAGAAKLARKGLARETTVREALLNQAEQRIQETMRRHPDHPAVQGWQQRLDEADKIRAELQRRGDVELGLVKGRPGAQPAALFEASPDAVHIGNPVEKSRLTGKPRVSSSSTFGHTQKPSSLRVSTGGAVEHALERNDVTRIVAERHAEAVRLSKIDRAVTRFKQAGELAPRRPDDVWMWTDELLSSERIPKEVRAYLNDPASIAKLAPDEQQNLFERVKEAAFQTEDWRNPEKVAEFQNLAKQGKGVFVPRRLLGELARGDYTIGHLPGVGFVDAVNNAQKAGLVYLKLNYPVIQALSNAAMGIIQQGFAYPGNLTKAVRLDHAIGPEWTAVVDDIMGQGAVMQAAFEGRGAVSQLSQRLARIMSHGVDTPARRAAFLYEARRAGYDTPEKLEGLLTQDAHSGDLGEVAQRAKEAIVDYGDLGPFERSVVRRLVFVYPWQKGATKYAAHFLRDHPIQAAAVSQTGRFGKQQSDEGLGPVPSYLEGSFDVGGRLVNPAGVNFFQTPAQIGQAVGGLITGNPAEISAGQGFLAPAPGVVVGLLTGRDDTGRRLDENILAKLRDLTVAQTPLAAAARALLARRPDLAGELARRLGGSHTSSQSFPDPNDPLWRFILGGLYPREYSRPALNENAALQKTGR